MFYRIASCRGSYSWFIRNALGCTGICYCKIRVITYMYANHKDTLGVRTCFIMLSRFIVYCHVIDINYPQAANVCIHVGIVYREKYLEGFPFNKNYNRANLKNY